MAKTTSKDSLKNTSEKDFFNELSKNIERSPFSAVDILRNFGVYAPRQAIARFLNRYEIYKQITHIHGSVLEFGVYQGAGAFSWFHFATVLEPYNISRKIFAFDTFEGFPETTTKDSSSLFKGDLRDTFYDELVKMASLQLQNIPLNHIPRLEFVKGDICKTLPAFLKENPYLIAALIYIDVDVYKPTKAILQQLLKHIPKGGIIAFDEINDKEAKGETIALLEEMDINKFQIRRHSFDSFPCYLVI